MTAPMFSLTEDSRGKSIAIFFSNGDTETISETHVSFKSIIEKLLSGTATDEEIRPLTQIMATIVSKMTSLSERVSVDGKTVYFDGDPIRGEISDIIKKMFEEGRTLDFKPLVNFLEKAKTNPSLKSIDDLYRWIRNGDLVIDPDGDIVAYKGVAVNRDGISVSIHSGTAFVNGEQFTGQIPNKPGTIITMPRSNVDDNEAVACSTGLHAGTYSYASSFAQGRLILVKINPRDVVSVPSDSRDQKLRVSRYTVLSEIAHRIESHYYQPELDEYEDEDEGYGYDEEDLSEEDQDDENWDSYADWEKALTDPGRYESELEDAAKEEEDSEESEEEESPVDAPVLGSFERWLVEASVAADAVKKDWRGRPVS